MSTNNNLVVRIGSTAPNGLTPRLEKVILRDFRTVNAAILLADIHRTYYLGRTTLNHIKTLLSGVFTYAKNQGVLDGINPISPCSSLRGLKEG
jgi:hypothetical protein